MAKKPVVAAVAASTVILIAVGELRGGTIDDKTKERRPVVLADGAELTAEKRAALGLDDDAVADLVERGKLVEVRARVAEAVGADELAAAIARAEAAEAEAKVLIDKVEDLEKQLAEATKNPA